MTYFISGHRNITQEDFDKYYVPLINNALKDKDVHFVVGDCEGADSMAQNYLKEKEILNVTVYHMFDSPRYLADEKFSSQGGFKSDVERDSAMTIVSQVDIAVIGIGRWTSGTAQNILRRYERELTIQ